MGANVGERFNCIQSVVSEGEDGQQVNIPQVTICSTPFFPPLVMPTPVSLSLLTRQATVPMNTDLSSSLMYLYSQVFEHPILCFSSYFDLLISVAGPRRAYYDDGINEAPER